MNIKIFNLTDEDVFLCSSSSKGNQSKWKRDNFFIKKDYLGYESIAEIVSAKLASCIENFNSICVINIRLNELEGKVWQSI